MHVFLTGPGFEHRGYKTAADRKRAVRHLEMRGRRCVTYKDVNAEFAVQITLSKSDIMMRAAKKLGYRVITIKLNKLEAEDVLGLPAAQ